MTAADTVRVGVIGAGYISDYHLAGLAATGAAEVPVLMGRTASRAAAVAKRFSVPEVVTDYRAVLERKDVDAVIIATPDFTHEAIAVAAAEAGKAIMLQKPMARNAAECRRIIQAAERAGVYLQVSFMHRYFEEVARTRELLNEGKLGEVMGARMRNATPGPDWADWFFNRDNVGGGVVMQLGVHGIDLIRHLIGDIEAVSATVATLRKRRTLADGRVVQPDNEDQALALYRLGGDLHASHDISGNEIRGCDRFRMEIYCADATLILRGERGALALYAPQLTGSRGWFLPELPQPPLGARHHQHWLDVIRGKAPRDQTARDGLAGILVAEALYQAADSQREQPVTHVDHVLGDA